MSEALVPYSLARPDMSLGFSGGMALPMSAPQLPLPLHSMVDLALVVLPTQSDKSF